MTFNPYAGLQTSELARMKERAWYDAARAWSDLRRYRSGADGAPPPTPGLDAILACEADNAEAYWHTLADESRRRIALHAHEA